MATTIKPTYAATVTLTVTALQSLANDSTNLLAGWQTQEVDNSTNLNMDDFIAGTVRTGTSPTANNQIQIWIAPVLDGGSTYPDTITGGGQATKTLTSTGIKNSGLRLAQSITVSSTSNVVYPFQFFITDVFPTMPKKYVVFFINGSGAALNASGNAVYQTGVYYTNA